MKASAIFVALFIGVVIACFAYDAGAKKAGGENGKRVQESRDFGDKAGVFLVVVLVVLVILAALGLVSRG